jgi:hypothetical protein
MEVLFNGADTWGAVGFRNTANDSKEDKTWVRDKFQSDLTSAISEKAGLESFVFFTNVDLTPAEARGLQTFAESKGIVQCEIFWRERLRILLDSASGLGLRYQYLGIPLSEAEQVAFFERFGLQLEQLMLKQFDHVDRRLARIEFFHDCAKPLMGISMIIELRRPYAPHELGHFRALIEIINLHEAEPHPTLWVACRDAYPIMSNGENKTLLFGSKSLVWSRNPDEMIQSTAFSAGQTAVSSFEAGGHIHKRGPYPTMGSLDSRTMWVFVTRPLFEVMAAIGLEAQGYLLSSAQADELEVEQREPLTTWPEPLSNDEMQVPWVMLRAKRNQNDPPWRWPQSWSLDFSKFTPEKIR